MPTEQEILHELRIRYARVEGPFKTENGVVYFKIEGKPPLTLRDARKLVGKPEKTIAVRFEEQSTIPSEQELKGVGGVLNGTTWEFPDGSKGGYRPYQGHFIAES